MNGWLFLGSTALGCAIVAMVLIDVLITALHPSVESLFSARFHRAVWSLIRRLSRLLPARTGRRMLGWTVPLSIAGLVLSWMFWLLVGYGLIYLPNIGQSHAFYHVSGASLGWGDAFYFSGVCLTSVGFGDIVPLHGFLRFVSIFEGLSSLVIIGVAVTYVLAVFPVLPIANVLAATLNEETDGNVDAVPLVRRYLSVGATEALAQRCRELSSQIMILSEAHTTHPVLFYAHPTRPERSFLRILIVTQRLVALLRYALRASDYPALVQDPRVVGLEESLIAVLRQMGGSLHLQVQAPRPGAAADLQQAYHRLIAELRTAGLHGDATLQRRESRAYARFRLVTDPYIDAYWANSGYTRDDLWGPHPPLRGTTAPIPMLDDDDEAADNAG